MSISIRKAAAAILVAGIAAAPVVSAASASATVARPQTTTAARSVTAFVTNNTGCLMTLFSASLAHGGWVTQPAFQIPNGKSAGWESENEAILTGTEGTVSYQLGNCANPAQNSKFAVFHWDNPYIGSNSYDNVGTTQGVTIARVGGSGNDAIVNWFAS